MNDVKASKNLVISNKKDFKNLDFKEFYKGLSGDLMKDDKQQQEYTTLAIFIIQKLADLLLTEKLISSDDIADFAKDGIFDKSLVIEEMIKCNKKEPQPQAKQPAP